MGIREKEWKDLGEGRYELTALPAGVVTRLQCRLIKMAAPLLGGASSAVELARRAQTAFMDARVEDLGHALATFAASLDGDEVDAMHRLIADHVRVETGPGLVKRLSEVFDDHFSGDRYFELWELTAWVLGKTFRPFVERLTSRLQALRASRVQSAPTEASSPSPTTAPSS